MSSPWFPVPIDIFKAKIEFRDFKSGDVLRPHDDVVLRTTQLDHPDGTNGYRLEYAGRTFALLSDTEGFPGKRDKERLRSLAVPISRSTMRPSRKRKLSQADWGHSTWARGVRMADEAGVKHLCLFHHDPSHDDDFMDTLAAEADDVRAGTIVGAKARLSICDRSTAAAAKVWGFLFEHEQRIVVTRVLGIDDKHRPVVQDQPFLLVSHRHDRMFGLVLVVMYDNKPEIVVRHPQCAKYDVLYDCVVLTIAGFAGERLKW